MGAVPGSRLLSEDAPVALPGAFDVESFRSAGRRVVLRHVDRPLLVLGSLQPAAVVDTARATRSGVEVVRRRSGGGAVLLLPGAQVWADLWVPRDDPLWSAEPRASAIAAGEWWSSALGSPRLAVHRGAPLPALASEAICFAGLGVGEVHEVHEVHEAHEVHEVPRKVVGLAQWRSREGALVHGCAYRRWDPEPLVDLLVQGSTTRRTLAMNLRDAAAGFEELGLAFDERALVDALPDPPTWEVLHA